MLKVLALRERFAHMSTVSGYDALYRYFSDEVNVDSVFCNFKKIYPRGIGRLLATASKLTSTSSFYNAQSIEAESKLLFKYYTRKYDAIHYAYGEPYYGLLGITAKKRNTAVVITHHQPVSWWQGHESLLKGYDKADNIIALSEYDRDYFEQYIPGKVVYIPHGVDTRFYHPSAKKMPDDEFRVIFAGRYLRDMVTLAAVIKKVSSTVKFDIVYVDKANVWEPELKEIMAMPNVEWHANIDEHALLALYQRADCCLVPLQDCTANNAILEAMSCGLPLVSTDLPAIKSYLDSSIALLGKKGNANDLCEALMMLQKNTVLRRGMASAARQKALANFDWNKIAAQTLNLFKSFNE